MENTTNAEATPGAIVSIEEIIKHIHTDHGTLNLSEQDSGVVSVWCDNINCAWWIGRDTDL